MTTTEIIRTGALRAGITTAFARGRRVPALQVLGAAMVGSIVLFSLAYPLLPGYDPFAQDLSRVLAAPGAFAEHWLGTDALGRDEASRLALAGRVTLGIVLLIVVVNSLVGMAVGTWSGYVGGRTDNVLMGLADIQLAMPVILVLIALAASLGPSVWLMITVLAATYWVGYARVARSTAMALRDRDFVLAPRLQGAGGLWTVRRHIVPNVAVQMMILASSDIGAVMLLTSSFDFLGLGVQAPTPSWGLMISEGQDYVRQAPHLAIIPGVAIFLTVAGTNLLSQRFTAEGSATTVRRTSRRSVKRSLR
ncbi:ABC transporter permease [Rathayibacter sp. VKM Ac-2856]|uniref:ABC transporter permease n=1 Tax=unclassified Rathayibacter TaxID=2609250 RepID=UPI001566A7C4|nr:MULTISPECIES: ABC transporter permease [unclassified Rathayibacter]NQX05373.1 ABC transporter permease [Rathayibacter sp. VKM Ac-2858]NQX20752.1 ABC transporter permease [Rathayibacter sp. VKM Ac-2856]